MKKTRPEYPQLRFYYHNVYESPVKIWSRESYDEANGWAMTMYRPENWESFHRKQLEDVKFFEDELRKNGHILQIGKVAVESEEHFLTCKERIEAEDGFVKWG
jgi:hypothetical protein